MWELYLVRSEEFVVVTYSALTALTGSAALLSALTGLINQDLMAADLSLLLSLFVSAFILKTLCYPPVAPNENIYNNTL